MCVTLLTWTGKSISSLHPEQCEDGDSRIDDDEEGEEQP